MTGETTPQGGESLEAARQRIFAEIRADMEVHPDELLNSVLLEALEDDLVLKGYLLGEERRARGEQSKLVD
jgi:hypothetical protein